MLKLKYIILDTNCFLAYLRKDNSRFNYEAIAQYAKENDAFIVISAYSLYEIIQNLTYVSEIEMFRNQLISVGDFWVLNTNGILEHSFLENGIDFLFSLSMHRNELLVDFSEKRKQLRSTVYKTLFGKMYIYSALAATAFLILNYCDRDGSCNQDIVWKIHYIDNHFFIKHRERYDLIFTEAYKHAGLHCIDPYGKGFYIDDDAKNHLRERMLNLIIEILAVSEVELSLAKGEWEFNNNEYNGKIVENCMILTKEIHSDSFRAANQRCSKRTKKKINIHTALDQLMAAFPDNINKRSYTMLLTKLFDGGGFGKSFNNDFIDFSNLSLLDSFPVGSAVYLTDESIWRNFMYENKEYLPIKASIKFYERFLSRAILF